MVSLADPPGRKAMTAAGAKPRVRVPFDPPHGLAQGDHRDGHPPGSPQVVAVEIHHLVPGADEVAHECPLRVVARVDLREGSELRV